MRKWTRLYFCRNLAVFRSNCSTYHNYPHNVNILPTKLNLHREPLNLWCIKRLTSDLIHQRQSDSEVIDVPVSELLSGLNSRLTEAATVNSIDEILKDSELHSGLIQCTRRLSQFTNNELLDYIDLLAILKSNRPEFHKHKTTKKIMNSLDRECTDRLYKLNFPSILPIMEKYASLVKHYSNFLTKLMGRYSRKVHKQPLDIFIRFLETANKYQIWQEKALTPYEFEYFLERNFDKLDIDQITTLTSTLIHLKKSIVSFELKKKLFLYATNNFDTMNHSHLNKFLNLFCVKESFFINMTTFTPEFLRLLDTFDKKFNTFSLDCVASMSMLTTKFLVHKPEFLDKIYSRFLLEGASARKTTIDKIIYSLIFFNYRSADEDVYSKILQIITADTLKSQYQHTKRYIRLISRFCNVGVYDYNIINEILDESYLKKTYPKKMNRFSLYPYPLIIDSSIQIECPDYSGHRLNSKLRDDLLRCYEWDLIEHHSRDGFNTDQYQLTDDTEQYDYKWSSELSYSDILKEISTKLNELYDKEITHLGYVLPHMPRPNLLFCLDNDQRPQNLNYLGKNSLVDWNKLDFRYKWYVLTVLVRNTSLPDAEVFPWGIEITKIRHLQKLNFNVTAVVQDEWQNMSEEQKTKFCSNLIQHC